MLPESLSALVKVMVTAVPAIGLKRPLRRLATEGRLSAIPANESAPPGAAAGGATGTFVVKEPAPVRPGR